MLNKILFFHIVQHAKFAFVADLCINMLAISEKPQAVDAQCLFIHSLNLFGEMLSIILKVSSYV